MWDPSSPLRDQTQIPALEAQSLNHWTTREVPLFYIVKSPFEPVTYVSFPVPS